MKGLNNHSHSVNLFTSGSARLLAVNVCGFLCFRLGFGLGFRLAFGLAFIALLALGLALPIAAFSAAPLAGTDLENQASINYSVAGTPGREALSNKVSLKIDRVLSVSVEYADIAATPVFSQQTNVAMPFTVTNLSNDTIDIVLSALSTEHFTSNNNIDNANALLTYHIVVDDGDNLYEPNEDTATYIDNIASNDAITVFIVTDIPNTFTENNLASISLIAQVAEQGALGASGTIIMSDDSGHSSPSGQFAHGITSEATTTVSLIKNDRFNEVLNVFVDGGGLADEDLATNGVTDEAFNGQHSDTGAFMGIARPAQIIKSAKIIDDDGGSEPYSGAQVEYTLLLNSTQALNNALISDNIPDGTVYQPESLKYTNSTGQTLNLSDASDADNGIFDTANNGIAVSIGTLAANQTVSVSFIVEIE